MAEKVIKSCGNQQAQLQQVSPLFKSQSFCAIQALKELFSGWPPL